jgi:hypothetical protein
MRTSIASAPFALLAGVSLASLVALGTTAGCVTSTNNAGPDGGPGVGLDGALPGNDGGGPADGGGGDAADGAVVPSCPALTGAGTTHTGTISADTTWTAAASPHLITFDMAIDAAVTLTLEPCAVVQFSGAYGLTVKGKLYAPGTPANPIRIEGSDPAKPFTVIQTVSGASVDLANVTIKNGGSDRFYQAPLFIRGDGVAPKPVLRAVNVTIDGAPQFGLILTSFGQMTADSAGLTIKNAQLGPVRGSAPLIGSLPRGAYTGNGVDEILIDADAPIAADMTLKDLGAPYRLGNVAQNASGDLRVGASTPDRHAVLTLEQGVTVRVEPAGRILMQASGDATSSALGAVVAKGSATKPIVFTSAAATPAAGDWVGLYFSGTPDPLDVLDFVHVDFAGGPSSATSFHCDPQGGRNEAEDAAILILGGPPAAQWVTNSSITSSKGYGIDRGWHGAPIDFASGNTFTAVAKCSQSYPVQLDGLCPAVVPCP